MGVISHADFRFVVFSAILSLSASLSTAQDRSAPSLLSDRRLIKEFIEEEMQYPSEALQLKIEGAVEIGFRVDVDGSVHNIRVTSGVSPEIDAEAVRVFSKILWQPGVVMGKKQPMDHSFIIRFDHRRYRKAVKKRGYDAVCYPYEPVDQSGKVYELSETDQAPHPLLSSLDGTLNRFVASNLRYPEAAFKQNISGTTEIRFVVEPGGRISNIHPVTVLGGGCTEEAIRIVRLLNWKPGIKDGKAVRVFNSLKITFDIKGNTVGGSTPVPGQVQ